MEQPTRLATPFSSSYRQPTAYPEPRSPACAFLPRRWRLNVHPEPRRAATLQHRANWL